MGEDNSTLGVAIVGCGTVGGSVALLLTNQRDVLAERIVPSIKLLHICDVDFSNARSLGLNESLLTDDLEAVLSDERVDVIVELIGGTTIAKTVIEKAIAAGKNVVTANKALLAYHGTELYALARANGVCIAFEASCAGGIPIIRALTDGLIANRIDAVYGIVNGTCNYILSEMTTKGSQYPDTLAQAQAAGLAEADPTLDVCGGDSAHKLAILASLAFGKQIDFDQIPVQGIDTLDLCDVEYGKELGYVVKLLAIAQRHRDGLCLRVRPEFISRDHPLAWVSGPFNAVSVYGHASGHTMHYGRGAGGMPTASAVLADIAAIATGLALKTFNNLRIWPDLCPPANQLPIDAVNSRYYIRANCQDRPGVLAQIASIFGENNISICSVLQHEESDSSAGVPLIITTYKAREANVRAAISQIDSLEVIVNPTTCIGIVEEHPEQIMA